MPRINMIHGVLAAAAALGVAACASPKAKREYSGDSDATAEVPRSTLPRDLSPRPEAEALERAAVCPLDPSRRSELQSSLSARVEAASQEIESLRSAAAVGSECERRMGYLEAVRDSARETVAKLGAVEGDVWVGQCADAEDRVSGLERYLANERASCLASR